MQNKRDKVKALRMKLKDKRKRKGSVIRTYLDLQDLHDLDMFIQHLTHANNLLSRIESKAKCTCPVTSTRRPKGKQSGTKAGPNRHATTRTTKIYENNSVTHLASAVFTIPITVDRNRVINGDDLTTPVSPTQPHVGTANSMEIGPITMKELMIQMIKPVSEEFTCFRQQCGKFPSQGPLSAPNKNSKASGQVLIQNHGPQHLVTTQESSYSIFSDLSSHELWYFIIMGKIQQ